MCDCCCALRLHLCDWLLSLRAQVLRIFRLFKVMSRLKQSKALAIFAKKYLVGLNPAMVRLLELVMIVVLIWHYVGCLWWYIGGESSTPEWERVSVLQRVSNTSAWVRRRASRPFAPCHAGPFAPSYVVRERRPVW